MLFPSHIKEKPITSVRLKTSMGKTGARSTKISKNTSDGDTVVRLKLFHRTEFVAYFCRSPAREPDVRGREVAK